MTRSLNTAATGMMAQQLNLDVISNNLSNVNTAGYKQQRAKFEDLMYQTMRAAGVSTTGAPSAPESLQVGLGTRFSSTNSSFSQGTLEQTSNPLDLAVNGSGFFRVLQPDGSFAYTRDGGFKMDANGLVVNQDGYALDPPVTIPTGSTAVTISPTGSITVVLPGAASSSPIEPPIQVTTFANPAGLSRVGQNLYKSTAASGDPVENQPGQNGSGTLSSGFVEGSNVQVVEEMVAMISAQRAYELNSKAIQTSDEMLTTLNGLKR